MKSYVLAHVKLINVVRSVIYNDNIFFDRSWLWRRHRHNRYWYGHHNHHWLHLGFLRLESLHQAETQDGLLGFLQEKRV